MFGCLFFPVVWASEPARPGDETTYFLLKIHRIPHRDPPIAKSRRRTHVRRMCASYGHCQNPARRQALDRSHWAIRSE
jgi:hypothetical protein